MRKKDGSSVRFRIQILDIVGLLFVFLCVVGLLVRTGKLGVFSERVELENYRLRFSVTDIAATSVDAFVIGDTFTLVSYHEGLGRLVAVESVSPAAVYVENDQHEIVRAQYPEGTRVDVVGILDTKGTMGDGGFSLGGTLVISPGIEYRIQSEHLDIVLKVIDIEKW